MFEEAKILAAEAEKTESFVQYLDRVLPLGKETYPDVFKEEHPSTFKESMKHELIEKAGGWQGKMGRIFNNFPALKDTQHQNAMIDSLSEFHTQLSKHFEGLSDDQKFDEMARLKEEMAEDIQAEASGQPRQYTDDSLVNKAVETSRLFAYFACHYLLTPEGKLKPGIESAIDKALSPETLAKISGGDEAAKIAAVVNGISGQIIGSYMKTKFHDKVEHFGDMGFLLTAGVDQGHAHIDKYIARYPEQYKESLLHEHTQKTTVQKMTGFVKVQSHKVARKISAQENSSDKENFSNELEKIQNEDLKKFFIEAVRKTAKTSDKFPSAQDTKELVNKLNAELGKSEGLTRAHYLDIMLESIKKAPVFSRLIIPKETFPEKPLRSPVLVKAEVKKPVPVKVDVEKYDKKMPELPKIPPLSKTQPLPKPPISLGGHRMGR